MNTATYTVIAAVILAFILALRYSLTHKGCGGNCGECMYKDSCHKSK